MKRYKYKVETGYHGADHEEIFEFDDDVTKNQLDDCLVDFVWECIEAWYEEIEGDDE